MQPLPSRTLDCVRGLCLRASEIRARGTPKTHNSNSPIPLRQAQGPEQCHSVLYLCCIFLGAVTIALVALYEKRRDDIHAAVRQFKQWQR